MPTNAAVAFPLGARIEIAQTGAGQITISGGFTFRLPSGKTAKTRLQYSIIALTKRGADEWILSGALASEQWALVCARERNVHGEHRQNRRLARSDGSAVPETGRDRRLLWRALRRAARTEHRIATA